MGNKNETDIRIQFQPYLQKIPDTHIKIYIQNRVIEQIYWYDTKSVEKQQRFKQLSIITVLLNAIIPVITFLSEYGITIRILIVSISSAAVAINAVLSLCSYKELWVQYRSSCELLKSILYRYFNRSGEFRLMANKPEQCAQMLVTLCEEYITKEFQSWSSRVVQEFPQNTLPSNQHEAGKSSPHSPDSTNS